MAEVSRSRDTHWVAIAWVLTLGLVAWIGFSIFAGWSTSHSNDKKPTITLNVDVKSTDIKDINTAGNVVFKRIQPHDFKVDVKNWGAAIVPVLNKAVQDVTKDQIEGIEKRVGDTWSAVQGIGLISAVVGVLITVVILYFSFQNSSEINKVKENFDSAEDKLFVRTQEKTLERIEKDLPRMLNKELGSAIATKFEAREPQGGTYIQKMLSNELGSAIAKKFEEPELGGGTYIHNLFIKQIYESKEFRDAVCRAMRHCGGDLGGGGDRDDGEIKLTGQTENITQAEILTGGSEKKGKN